MAKAKNTFLKSKMNKDLDARILSTNEYRNAVNVQVSKSEGDQVGSLENVLGNTVVAHVDTHTGASGLQCIGQVSDDSTGRVYLFYTNHSGNIENYNPLAGNFIVSLDTSNNSLTTLVEGAFLNFSTENPIYGINILENLLFWTDNRNQPRKINIKKAQTIVGYYTTEDQISVAKYNPYAAIELYDESSLSTGDYETTMKDVSSFYMPNGGQGVIEDNVTAGDTQVNLSTFKGDIVEASGDYGALGATVSYTTESNPPEIIPVTGVTVDTFTYNDTASPPVWEITVTGGTLPALNSDTQEIVLNSNPYYNKDYAGDSTYLEDKFVRFGYRFKFDDDEYSLFSTFTQSAFIPKQDGYFMYVEKPEADNIESINDQDAAFRSTIVSFVENKVGSISLRIPLPFKNYELESSLKVKSIDLLYKESDGISVKVIDTIDISTVFGAAAVCSVAADNLTPFTTVAVDNVKGGINVGDIVVGSGISTQVTVVSYTPDDVNQNPSTSGTIELSSAQTLTEDTILTVGDTDYYTYEYQSKKPFKTLPEKDTIRVYDKIPVRSFAQEVSGNRVIYGNYQDKHTAPSSLDYNVAITPKSDFNLNDSIAEYNGGGGVFPANTALDVVFLGDLYPGRAVTSPTPGVIIPDGTVISSTNNNGEGVNVSGNSGGGTSPNIRVSNTNGFIPVGATLVGKGVTVTEVDYDFYPGPDVLVIHSGSAPTTPGELLTYTYSSTTEAVIGFDNEVTFPAGPVALELNPGGDIQNTTSVIEYPNHSVKTNRTLQVGIVLSDRYGRQSSAILSNNKDLININGNTFSGSTVYSSYIQENVDVDEWPGNSIKVLFNKAIATTYNPAAGIPGVYNGDSTSVDYNPLGWYTFKIVVKQTEQEYYNVYLPGIMASYPNNVNLELGKTSHVALISDNINKIPRDLNEVGPVQDQFRSSVQLYGRVENSSIEISDTTYGLSNAQYYPGNTFDLASTVSSVNDLFDFDPQDPPNPNLFPQFYSLESNPYIARINTANKIGQVADVNFTSVSALVAVTATTDTLQLTSVSGESSDIEIGDKVTGPGFPTDLTVAAAYVDPPAGRTGCEVASGTSSNIVSIVGGSGSGGLIITGMVLDSQAGIPEGTVVLNTTVNTPNVDVEVSNVVSLVAGDLVDFSNPAQLVVSSPVSVTLGQTINVYSSESPGIQFLSVYETKPVESLLDIFWETSTTGRIKEINDIITNENPDGTGAGGLSPWNDNVFLESLRTGEDCLQAPVYLVDNFGVRISSNDITKPLSLDSAFDHQDPPLNVQQDYTFASLWPPVPTSVQPVFSFEETSSGSYEYMLKTDVGFYTNIYYGKNEGARNFTLNFSAEVNGLPVSITQNLELGNVAPHIPTSSGNSDSVNAFFDQQNVSLIKIYNGSESIQVGWEVNGVGLPENLTVSGSGYTPPKKWPLSSPSGVIETVVDSYTAEFYQWSGGGVGAIMIGHGLSTVRIPTNTYIVSKSPVVDGKYTATFNNRVTIAAYTENQAQVEFLKPATLEVSEEVTVTEGLVIGTGNYSEIWDDCPLGPIYPGGTDKRYVSELRAVNGAGWRSTDVISNLNRNKDLSFEKVSEFFSEGTISEKETDYFNFENPGSSYFNTAATIDLVNNGYQDSNMPSGVYTFTYDVSDPGDTTRCQVLINTGIQVCEVQEWTLTSLYRQGSVPYTGKFLFVNVCDPNGGAKWETGSGGELLLKPPFNHWYAWRNGTTGAGDFPSWKNLVESNGNNNLIITPYKGAPLFDHNSGWSRAYGSLGNSWETDLSGFSGALQDIESNEELTGGDLIPQANVWTLTAGTGTSTPLVPAVEKYSWGGDDTFYEGAWTL